MSSKRLRITLTRSIIGLSPGLRRMHQSVTHDDTPVIRGMIAKVPHVLEVSHEA